MTEHILTRMLSIKIVGLIEEIMTIVKVFFFFVRVSNSSDSDQTRHFVRPDLDPNCLQRLSADDTSWKRVTHFGSSNFVQWIPTVVVVLGFNFPFNNFSDISQHNQLSDCS